MDFSNSQESIGQDSAYSPQILNEVDTNMGGVEESSGKCIGSTSTLAHLLIGYTHSNQPPPQAIENVGDAKHSSPNLTYQPQPPSRPGSGLSGQQGHQAQYHDQGRHQQQQNKSSVVIKVGMVGDAQIGKTSLMVKYVEGSWDEDYIQTLGQCPAPNS